MKADEKLAVAAVGILRPGHANGAAAKRLGGEFGGKLLAGATHPGTGRITGLGHKPFNHTMENNAIIEAFAGKLLDPCNMIWGQVGAQFNHHAAILEVKKQSVFEVARIGALAGCSHDQNYKP